MPHRPTPPATVRSVITLVVAVCLIYGLGACPCGCLEHNVWAQMFGLGVDDHDSPAAPSSAAVAATSAPHDCDGHPPPLYVDNAGRTGQLVACSAPAVGVSVCRQLPRKSEDPGVWKDHRGPPSFSSSREHLAALQVYRL